MIQTNVALLRFVVGLVVVLNVSRTFAVDTQPNIVVILCDDLGYGDLGINGHPFIKTPHLDQLARDGIRFTNFYSAAPVCSPSRVGLLTGRSPNRAGVYDWIPPARKARSDAREQVHMRRDELTVAHVLQQAGYATCMAGKWHCNSAFNSSRQPQPGDAGFDHWLATQNNASPRHQNPVNYVRNGEPVGKMEGFSCQLAADEVIEWMESHCRQNADQPFFVYLAFHEPHEPIESPAELVSKYREVSQSDDEAQYYANVHNVDLAVGRVVEALEQLTQREQTLIVFSSDNGPETLNRYRSANRSWGSTGPLRGMKLHTHDGGFHVAGIANWPGTISKGQVVSTPVSALDLLPTFAELAGKDVPSDRVLDGVSLSELFTGNGTVTRNKPLVWTYFNGINDARVAMRHGPWKVLARLNDGELPRFENLTPDSLRMAQMAKLTDFEIYNVDLDPGETRNLSGRGHSEEAELTTLLKQQYRALVMDSPAWEPEYRKSR
jgi:arylsulfatase A-like enzyme